MNETSRLLTVRETCKYLRISAPTLYRMLERQELVPVKIGKRTLFDKKDLDLYIDASKGPATRKPHAVKQTRKGPAVRPKSKTMVERASRPEPVPKEKPAPKPKEEPKPKPVPDTLF